MAWGRRTDSAPTTCEARAPWTRSPRSERIRMHTQQASPRLTIEPAGLGLCSGTPCRHNSRGCALAFCRHGSLGRRSSLRCTACPEPSAFRLIASSNAALAARSPLGRLCHCHALCMEGRAREAPVHSCACYPTLCLLTTTPAIPSSLTTKDRSGPTALPEGGVQSLLLNFRAPLWA